MANSDEHDLMSLGQHCSLPGCGQIDFLPFICDGCSLVYCLDHRTYAKHRCASPKSQDVNTVVCPICAKVVKLEPGIDANVAFEQHLSKSCDPTNYDRVHKKTKCPVKGCKEKLTTVNTYHCKSCNLKVCLKHRDPVDHECQATQAAAKVAAAQRLTRQQQPNNSVTSAIAAALGTRLAVPPTGAPPIRTAQMGRQGTAGPAAARIPLSSTTAATAANRINASRQYEDPSNSVYGTVDRRRQQSQGSNANPLVAPHLPEVCEQCGARFANVALLIQHSEDYHLAQQPQQTHGLKSCVLS